MRESRKLAAVILGMTLGAPGSAPAQYPANWAEPFAPVQIADNLFYVGSAGLSSFLLTSDEGHVLIDATLEENVPRILENVRELGFEPRDIRVHLITHAHFDHVAGAAALLRATGAELLVSEGDASYVSVGRDFGFESDGYPPAHVSRIAGHLETVRVGDIELTAHVTPGHTPGCTSWSGEVNVSGTPHRFVLVCSLSVLGPYRLVGDDATYPGMGVDFCRSVSHLRTLSEDIFLSNHGGFFGLSEKAEARRAGDVNAFVDPGALDEFLDAAQTAIDRARAEQDLGSCDATAR